jgi:hypothetical protein
MDFLKIFRLNFHLQSPHYLIHDSDRSNDYYGSSVFDSYEMRLSSLLSGLTSMATALILYSLHKVDGQRSPSIPLFKGEAIFLIFFNPL